MRVLSHIDHYSPLKIKIGIQMLSKTKMLPSISEQIVANVDDFSGV